MSWTIQFNWTSGLDPGLKILPQTPEELAKAAPVPQSMSHTHTHTHTHAFLRLGGGLLNSDTRLVILQLIREIAVSRAFASFT